MTQITMEDQLQRVEIHADALWVALAIDAVESAAEKNFLFTTDDVWRELGEHPPREPRAMGAVMCKARRLNMITGTPMFQTTKRKASNNRPIRVWKSLIKNASY